MVHEASKPGEPQTNGMIEAYNGSINRGVKGSLVEAGLPDCFAVHGAPVYCHHHNVTIDQHGNSHWQLRVGVHWAGIIFPF